MTWPPSKPISMRIGQPCDDQLREDAVNGVGMDERDLEPEEPARAAPGRSAPRPAPRAREARRRRRRPRRRRGACPGPLREESADGRVLAERGEQLDPSGADEHCGGLDALIGHRGAMLQLGAEEPRVGRDRLVEVRDGDAEMVDAARGHAAMLPCAGAVRGTACDDAHVPTARRGDSGATSASRLSSSSRSSVSFSSSACATRSSATRCFVSRRIASA